MSSREIARQWFVPGDGIDRHVISADIQRYLGNDATVRPGKGTGEHSGVDGYWIKAYRNLTSAMIVDLRADSSRWRQEQRMTGTREPYVASTTYQQSSAGRPVRRDGDSPRAPDYGSSAQRIPVGRMPVDSMDIDPPRSSMYAGGPSGRGGYAQDSRPPFVADRGYPPEPQTINNAGYGGRPAVSAGFGSSGSMYQPQSSDGAPPGYVRQGNYYVPISSYDSAPSIPSRVEPPYGAPGFGGPPSYPVGREPPRYGQPDYQEASLAYPSPATTVSSMPARDRGAASAPQSYGSAMAPTQYDQYGRPIKEVSSSHGFAPSQSREAAYSRNPPSTSDSRDSRRRR